MALCRSFIKFTPLTCLSSQSGAASSNMVTTSMQGNEASMYMYMGEAPCATGSMC